MKRLLRGFTQIRRSTEVLNCICNCHAPLGIILGFLGLTKLEYPRIIQLKDGTSIEIFSWEDLTTIWTVWFGDEYRIYQTDKIVVDLGANIGAFSILAAKEPSRMVIAVEPFPENTLRLKKTLASQIASGQCVVVEAAVDAENRILYMPADSGIPSHSRTVSTESLPGALEVPTVTLAELVDMAGGNVDFLKVDIEGHEYALFETTPHEVLQKFSRIGLEYHGHSGHLKLVRLMREANFKLTRLCEHGSRGIVEFTQCTSR